MKPVVSVIIPAYNCASTIIETIESVHQQTYHEYEIIIIDDGSTDETGNIIRNSIPDAIYYKQVNSGPACARNKGVELSQGAYLMFLDSDDLLLPLKLELQVRYLEENPAIDVVYSDGYLIYLSKDGLEISKSLYSQSGLLNDVLGKPEQNNQAFVIHNVFPIHSALVRRKAVVEIGGFDESKDLFVLEDWDFWLRLGQKFTFGYLNEILTIYCFRDTGRSKNDLTMLKATQYLEKRIENSSSLLDLPPKTISRFYYYFAVYALKYGSVSIGRARFKNAIKNNPANLKAILGYLITLTGEKMTLKAYRSIYKAKTRDRFML